MAGHEVESRDMKMQDSSLDDCYRLLIQDIEIDCYLGVYEHEQARARPISIA